MSEFERARKLMVDTQLRTVSVFDRKLLAAMGSVPREHFVPESRKSIAYLDTTHPLNAAGRQMLSPGTFARMAQLAEIGPDDFVLDVGCGTGYTTAILANLASSVVGIEDDEALCDAANANLARLDIGNATAVQSNITRGLPNEAPFDLIMIEGAVDLVPQILFDQLRDGGRLVTMLHEGPTSTGAIYVRAGDDITVRRTFNASAPLLQTFRAQPVFSL